MNLPSSNPSRVPGKQSPLPGILGFGLALLLVGLGSAAMFWVTPVADPNPPSSVVQTPAPTSVPAPSSPPVAPAAPTLSAPTLPLETRQKIYKLLSSEEDKTIRTANAQFPGGGAKFQQFLEAQTQAYNQKIAQDNGATLEQVEQISLEGLTQGWASQ